MSNAMTSSPAPAPASTHGPTPAKFGGAITAAASAHTPMAAAMTATRVSGDVLGGTRTRYLHHTAVALPALARRSGTAVIAGADRPTDRRPDRRSSGPDGYDRHHRLPES
jgi:hypothetical protein